MEQTAYALAPASAPVPPSTSPVLLSMKERKAQGKLVKRLEREQEDRLRIEKRNAMQLDRQREGLVRFVKHPAMQPNGLLLPAVQLMLPLWDVDELQQDAFRLLESFGSGMQFGDTHGYKWRTLSLRSCDGTAYNDAPAPSPAPAVEDKLQTARVHSAEYCASETATVAANTTAFALADASTTAGWENEDEKEKERQGDRRQGPSNRGAPHRNYTDTPVWAASRYIVPTLLRSLGPALSGRLERVRLRCVTRYWHWHWHLTAAATAENAMRTSPMPNPMLSPPSSQTSAVASFLLNAMWHGTATTRPGPTSAAPVCMFL